MPETTLLQPAADNGRLPETGVWEHVARTVAWLDAANGRGAHEIALRVMKTAEEAGEVVAASIGVTGASPRNGTTATTSELTGELCDVALAALVGGTPQAEIRLAERVTYCAARLDAPRAAA
jgi:hypothetical protein